MCRWTYFHPEEAKKRNSLIAFGNSTNFLFISLLESIESSNQTSSTVATGHTMLGLLVMLLLQRLA
jgi:hypothetical protein